MGKLLLLMVCIVSGFVNAASGDGKYGSAQVFNVSRTPAFPVKGADFTVDRMSLPYELIDSSDPFFGINERYTIGTGQYATIEDIDNTDDCDYRIVLKEDDGTLIRVLQPNGSVYGLGDEGFLHVSEPGGIGTFFANDVGYNLDDSLTYTPDTEKATCIEFESYELNSTPIYNPYAPNISGTPQTIITLSTEFSFKPTVTDSDTALSALNFSIKNKPDWMTFIAATGELYGMPTGLGTYSDIEIIVSDGTFTVSLSPFSVTVVDGSIETSVSGGSMSVISILLGVMVAVVRRRKQFAMPLLLAMLPMKGVAAENQNWYLGVGGGVAKVKPEVNVVDYERDKDSSPVLMLNAGYCFTEKYCLDAKYTHVNNFEIASSNDSIYLDYHVTSVGVKYTPFLQLDYFTPYVIAGASYFNVNSASSLVETEEDVRFSYGIGAKVYEKDNVALLIDAMRHAKDLSSFTLSVQYNFSNESAENR
ncbi:outer membrane beta-barrel protein [Vibrio hepatarius]|uniref:outer membrane beta-barrel protein n=1 Tax=Vibrio hepatarius TaxID=171383 RepID=UPI00142D26E6|nr:outer membrane beta-barrel protein [Vibrio hepatarius]NIY82565.1 outer membrane beta-barrel protein [Vibrio hepatarius]